MRRPAYYTPPAARPPPAPILLEQLSSYLERQARTPFAWGRNDCCTFCADWLAIVWRVDPMAELRALYSDEASALELVRFWGLRRRWNHALKRLSSPTRTPFAGDVALVAHDGPFGLAGAIKTAAPGMWAMKHPRGLVVARLDPPPASAWRV